MEEVVFKRVAAYAGGWVCGASPAMGGADCPYSHAEADLRWIWLYGFSAGRASAIAMRAQPLLDAPRRSERG